MGKNTDDLRQKRRQQPIMDAFDRKILAELAGDSGQSYARLGEAVGLSAPAVHERVRRLRQSGAIKGVHAALDGSALGKPLLAFVHVEAAGWGKSERLMQVLRFPEVEEMHSVAGDASVLFKVRTASPQALEAFLSQIHAVPGVTGTRSYIALSTYLERPVQAGVTEIWPDMPLPE
ncbi:DNA-binding Lrp family transcriptional regulator [Rhizobium pisi]|uniref:DNA-binding Lrp family transcriptional regulator n=2 Tax=Rhizobium TaxID=379 RepID=A0A7W6FJQ7_9HYPH|nr:MULTISPECIES: Lrp/AsnC family transcriptional regulator [Rhizobium]MBB3132733.1 DNA-binding Lrp family transcriptional regulator [Rhizobium pisi]MBB3916533.1 DNA-binding Lrp family transcriptional regulator [Rhizobium fabae]RSB86420.1 Lrp/AsnC family transcriptional regulator [Rhizobium pisi]RUM13208.1 Lrp/AsnC family transcriptional regulator [Rhizobium fabae]TCA63122.1 Lrp/AsnC family transcriptional regulator [Rhizobium pisi]